MIIPFCFFRYEFTNYFIHLWIPNFQGAQDNFSSILTMKLEIIKFFFFLYSLSPLNLSLTHAENSIPKNMSMNFALENELENATQHSVTQIQLEKKCYQNALSTLVY